MAIRSIFLVALLAPTLTFVEIYLAPLAPLLTLFGLFKSSARYARTPKKCPRPWDFQMRAAREKMRPAFFHERAAFFSVRPSRETEFSP